LTIVMIKKEAGRCLAAGEKKVDPLGDHQAGGSFAVYQFGHGSKSSWRFQEP